MERHPVGSRSRGRLDYTVTERVEDRRCLLAEHSARARSLEALGIAVVVEPDAVFLLGREEPAERP